MNIIESYTYDFSKRALQKWETNRLNIKHLESGLKMSFNVKGSTCSNMGWPIIFSIDVDVTPIENDYKIEQAQLTFKEDLGYKKMCYFNTKNASNKALEKAPFEDGVMLNELIEKMRNQQPSGCLCNKKGRNYYWNIALQTTHYHLNNKINH